MRMKLILATLCLMLAEASASNIARQYGDRYHEGVKGQQPRAMDNEDKAYWNLDAQTALMKQIALRPKIQQAKNVIFFLGDGMSISTVTAARILKGSQTGKWERENLVFEEFPYSAFSKTYSTNQQVTDSAASATAYLCGVKTNNGVLGVDVNVKRYNCTAQLDENFHTDSIAKWFLDAGKPAGIVTPTKLTDATPAGIYSHIANRDWEDDAEVSASGEDPDVCDDIAEQMILKEPGRSLKVILGGGRQRFIPEDVLDVEEGLPGYRKDGKNLIEEWIADKEAQGFSNSYVWDRDGLMSVDVNNTEFLLGFFAFSEMSYVLERDPSLDPTLPEMTKIAIEMLQREGNGFFLLVEGGRIDHAHHANWVQKSLAETLEFDAAVETALSMTNPEETLILVTADHGHSLTINGEIGRESDILGIAGTSDVDNLHYTTLLYGNGPGYSVSDTGIRYEPTESDISNFNYRYSSSVPYNSAKHDGADVGIWATGPHAHLFSGVCEENYIAHALAYAACVGNGITFCDA